MQVSIIIVSYNTCRLLCDCLDSIYQQTKELDFEVIVVDNASKDDTCQVLELSYPQVRLIRSAENLGFGRANNLGVQYAKGEYLLFLNSDTILLNNAISIFYQYAQEHSIDENIGVLGGILLDRELMPNISAGEFPTPKSEFRYIFHKLFPVKNVSDKKQRDVDFVVGADMFIRRDLFIEIGGFDPQFFMYYEETDLQYRFAKVGYIRRIINGPRIIHLEGGSFESKGLSLNRFIMSQKSYNYYLEKHYFGLKYFLYKGTLCLIRLSLLFTQFNWSLKERFKAYGIVLLNNKS